MTKRFLFWMILLVVVSVMGLSISMCSYTEVVSREATQVIPILEGDPRGIAWVEDALFVQLSLQSERSIYRHRLWKLDLESHAITMTAFPNTLRCPGGRYGFEEPTRLPDGRLGYLLRCGLPPASSPALYPMAYDPHTEAHTMLRQEPLLSPLMGTGGYSWNPTVTRGIMSDVRGRLIHEQLYWFTETEWAYIDVNASLAHAPSWSPDGRQIAFLAAPEQGRSGIARLDSFFYLYLMQPDGTQIQSLAGPLSYPSDVEWSPDGKWLILVAYFRWWWPGQNLWLIDATTGDRRLLMQGSFSDPAWSPDGRQVAVIENIGDYTGDMDPDTGQLVVIDMTPLLGPE